MPTIPKTVSSRSLYKNNFLEIKVDKLEMNGNEWEYAYFIKPNKNSVGVLAVDDAGIYLVQQYRYPCQDFFWQIPGGMIDDGLTELDTAKKELIEETGITAEKLTLIGTVVAEPGMSGQKTFIYVGEGLTLGEKHLDITEIGMRLKHFTFEEVDESIKNGTITCGFTLSALLLFKTNYTNISI